MAKQLKVDGTMVDIGFKPCLETLQAAVGGYIAPVGLNPETGYKLMWVNEAGLDQNLPLNMTASDLAGSAIVGDVVVLAPDEVTPDEE